MGQLINQYITVGSGIKVPNGPLKSVQTQIQPKPLDKNLISGIDQGLDFISGMITQDHSGKYGSYGQTGDQVYDGVTSAVSKFNPAFGLAMKGYGVVHDTLAGLGASTDGETRIDALLNSKLAGPIGLVNGLFGTTSNKMYLNQDTINSVGGSFGGTVDDLLSAKEKSNKKFGVLSLGKKNSYNDFIMEALRKQLRMTNISDEAKDQRAMINDQLGVNYQQKIDGGIDFTNIRNNKQGGKLSWEPTMQYDITEFKEGGNITWEPVLNYDFIPEFQEGGNFPQEYIDFINDVKEHSPNLGQLSPEGYNMYRSWELNGKPRTFEEGLQENMYSLHMDGTYHGNTIAWNKETNEGEWLKHKNYKTSWMEKAFYDGYTWEQDEKGNPIFSDDQPLYEGVRPILKKLTGEELEKSEKFRSQYDLVEDSNGWRKYVPKKFKQGGSIKESETPKIEETTQKNLIPEGALHKNKHHMENDENITKKGIPVIDNDGNQQAEIERDELIVTLEVTKFIEERYKKYYSDELTAKEKDKLAIEVGELLVYEILNNTDDRTDLISKCEKGGKL